MMPGPDSRAPGVALWSVLALLVLATSVPAALSWRLIADYDALAVLPVQVESQLSFDAPPGAPPFHDGQGLTVAADGTVFATDLAGGRVLAFPPGSHEGRVFAPAPGQPALRAPCGVALAPDQERVYVLDQPTGMVLVYDRAGTLVRTAQLGQPGARGITVDAAGRVYVADTGTGLVKRFTPDLEPDLGWGDTATPGASQVGGALGLAVVDGSLYASIPEKFEVVRLDPNGRIRRRVSSRGNASWLAATPDRRLLMSDIATNRVWLLDGNGRTVGRLISEIPGVALFGQPRGLALQESRLYVLNDSRVTVYRVPEWGHAIP
jgi:DNA-binding beta-propeller fold protein YncE